jgi:uncharacterized DUF497 family protein
MLCCAPTFAAKRAHNRAMPFQRALGSVRLSPPTSGRHHGLERRMMSGDEARMGRRQGPGKNGKKHGFDFTFASRIFNGPVRRFVDPRRWGEERIVAAGQVEGRFIAVVHTRRGERYRIILARPARSNERF